MPLLGTRGEQGFHGRSEPIQCQRTSTIERELVPALPLGRIVLKKQGCRRPDEVCDTLVRVIELVALPFHGSLVAQNVAGRGAHVQLPSKVLLPTFGWPIVCGLVRTYCC